MSVHDAIRILTDKVHKLETALATERERNAKALAVCEKRDGYLGTFQLCAELREALAATPPDAATMTQMEAGIAALAGHDVWWEQGLEDSVNTPEPDAAPPPEPKWRTGKTVGHTLYRNDIFAGSCVSAEIAAELVASANGDAVEFDAPIMAQLVANNDRLRAAIQDGRLLVQSMIPSESMGGHIRAEAWLKRTLAL